VDKGVLVVEKLGWFQVLDLDQKISKSKTLICKKNPNPETLHIKNSKNGM